MLQIFRSKYEWIFDYTIYGERHSGTNFLESCIKQQFGLDITYFYGFKHFFGWTKPEILTYKARHTLFLGITRHPYDWNSSKFLTKIGSNAGPFIVSPTIPNVVTPTL